MPMRLVVGRLRDVALGVLYVAFGAACVVMEIVRARLRERRRPEPPEND